MSTDFQRSFTDLMALPEHREYNSLPGTPLPIPDQFNWVRDVFEPFIVTANADRNLLELVTGESSKPAILTYQEAVEKCNQLLNFLRRQEVKQGDRVFMLCGLLEGVWISYLAVTKGGLVLIPAASILSADDIIFRFERASPSVIISDMENAARLEQALLTCKQPAKVKLLLDGERDGWVSLDIINREAKEAVAADTGKDEDLFWFFTSGTTGMPKVVAHTQASYLLGHLTTASWIGLKPGDRHYNISQPGWAKFAWSCIFAPLNVGATVFIYKPKERFVASD